MSRIPFCPLALALLMMTSWACLVQDSLAQEHSSLPAGGSAQPQASNLVDHGDGTATLTIYADQSSNPVMDTWLEAAQPTANHATDTELRVGYSSNNSSRWTSLVGLDLVTAGFWTNVTIITAELELHSRQVQGAPVVNAWMPYRYDWMDTTATWSEWDSGQQWEVAGGLGNSDSGGLMQDIEINSKLTWYSFDVTRSLVVSQYRWSSGIDSQASVLLSGPAWGDEWVTFDSSEFNFETERPRWNITFAWGTPSNPQTTTEWVDISPKPPSRIDSDSQLGLSAMARSGRAEVNSGAVSWSSTSGSIDVGGLFTPDTVGLCKIEADVLGVIGSVDVEVTTGIPQSITISPASKTITVDENISFVAELLDANGNHVDGAALTWHSDSGVINETGFYIPGAVGDDSVTVFWQSLSATASVTVTAGNPYHLIFEENLTTPAGQQLPLVYAVTDRVGNPLPNGAEGAITWQSENGQVNSIGVYTGEMVGQWQIYANSSNGASGQTIVEVTPGQLESIELEPPNGSQKADQPVPLVLYWHDIMGNRVPVRIPLSNWTAEDGNFRMTPNGVEWLPRREGNWTVGVNVEEQWANITISVVHGDATRLLIVSESETLTADDVIELQLHAEDAKGNRWAVSGNWSAMEPEAAPWLAVIEEQAHFTGTVAGAWTIKAEHEGAEGLVTAFLMLTVNPGSLAQIILSGHGEQVSADGIHDFNPRFYDEDGNELSDVLLNWTFTHKGDVHDRTSEMRSSDGIWYPVLAGHHEVEVDAGGVFSAIGIDVNPGIAHTVRSLQNDGLVIQSGSSVTVQINATDLDGNDFGADVLWDVPYNSVDIANGSRSGEYLLKGLGVGSHQLEFMAGVSQGELTVNIQAGDAVRIDVRPSKSSARVGDTMAVEIRIYDFGSNRLEVNPELVELSSPAGSFGHSAGDHWQMLLENSGEQQRITVTYGNVTDEAYIDVSPDPFRAFGDSSLANTLWGGIALVVILFVLLLGLLRTRSKKEEEALGMLYEDEESEPATPSIPTPTGMPQGYKPSSKSRRAARAAFAKMGPPTNAQPSMQMHPQMQAQHDPQMQAQQQAQISAQQQAATQQWVANSSGIASTESGKSEELTGSDGVWTTEQVWAWGRSQGWADEQIAVYEAHYAATVRDVASESKQPEQPLAQNTLPETTEFDASAEEKSADVSSEQQSENKTGLQQEAAEIPPSKSEDVRQKGVMKAMPGTEQGQSGWYLDGDGNPSRWEIDDAGNWHRTG